jgi:hypothetical protein
MQVVMRLDDTYTDLEFKRRLAEANRDWISQATTREPDLDVDGFTSSIISRLLRLLTPRNH